MPFDGILYAFIYGPVCQDILYVRIIDVGHFHPRESFLGSGCVLLELSIRTKQTYCGLLEYAAVLGNPLGGIVPSIEEHLSLGAGLVGRLRELGHDFGYGIRKARDVLIESAYPRSPY